MTKPFSLDSGATGIEVEIERAFATFMKREWPPGFPAAILFSVSLQPLGGGDRVGLEILQAV
jgi:hypothetical protein